MAGFFFPPCLWVGLSAGGELVHSVRLRCMWLWLVCVCVCVCGLAYGCSWRNRACVCCTGVDSG